MWKSSVHHHPSSSNLHLISEGSESSVDSVLNTTSTRNQMPTNGSHGHHAHAETSCHHLGRKKRRGMIEKRRRDRINNSLNELRRLVPAAFEKQGSAKLEKAEILQMTVDHLTMLHAKGFDAFSFDPHKFAMDYHSIGFRECTTETARYLVHVEGMELQDPLRLRLMSHLQCYAAQRELSLKTSAHASAWNPAAFTTPHQFATPAVPSQSTHHSSHSSEYWNPPSISSSATSSSMDSSHHHHHQMSMSHGHMMPPPSSLIKSSTSPPLVSSSCPSSSSPSNHLYSSATHASLPSTSSGHQYFPPGYGQVVTSGQVNGSSGSVKQFRPWGGELVY